MVAVHGNQKNVLLHTRYHHSPIYKIMIKLQCSHVYVFTCCYQNVVQNQETSDHNFSAWQGEINSAAQKVYFHYHIQYVQNISLRCLCIYWSCCYQNVVQNKDTSLENANVRVGEKTSAANKLVSFRTQVHILLKLQHQLVYSFITSTLL